MSLRTPSWLIGLLLVIALVPLGSAPTWAEYVLVTATASAFLALALRGIATAGVDDTARTMLSGVDGLALLCLPTIVVVQIVAGITTNYTEGALIDIVRAGLVLVATTIFYVLVHSAVSNHASFRSVLTILAAIGAIEAAYGVFNLLAGNERLLLYQRWAYHDSATGTLVGRNHFALLMEMSLPIAVVVTATSRSSRPAGLPPKSDEIAQRLLLGSFIVLIGLALVFSRSRMGVLSFAAACLVVLATARALRHDRSASKHQVRDQLMVPGVSLALVAIYVLVIGVTPAFERFANLATDLETGRLPIWKAAASMAMEKPLLGHGWGTFDSLIEGYKPSPTGLNTRYAHNDYLQVLVESGCVGLALVGWLLFVFARRFVSILAKPLPPDARTIIVWLGVAIVAALGHSLTDFGLRIPGVGFMFAAVLALFVRASQDPQILVKPRRRRRAPMGEQGVA
jgi:O-antigen ligase